jgi:hypothetical protein
MNHYQSTDGAVTRHIVTITTADHTRTICELENVYRHAAQGDNHDARLTETLAHGRLIAAAPQLLIELRALAHLSGILNARQHAGLVIVPVMWSELYDVTNRITGTLALVGE